MLVHRGIFAQPPPRSKVSRTLQLSRHEKLKLRLVLFAVFLVSLTGLLLLVNVVSSPYRFFLPHEEYRSSSDSSAWTSTSWGPYSPYYPVAKFEGSTRKGCTVSQVNIVSSVSPLLPIALLTWLSTASTPRSPIPNFRSGRDNPEGAQKASSRHQLQRL